MYVTADEVMEVTPYDNVTNEEVLMAQFVIEVYTGRVEGEVDGARDKALLARAVTAQTVYMRENPALTFEQIKAASINSGDGMYTFKGSDDESPFIAPLSIMACKHLSWKNTRSIRFGRIFQFPKTLDWRRD